MDQLRLRSFTRLVGPAAGGNAWVFRFKQGWRDAHEHLGDIQGPSRAASSRCRMRRKADIVSWTWWNSRARWWTNPSRDNCATAGRFHGSDKDHRTRRGDELEVFGSSTRGEKPGADDCGVTGSAVAAA